MCRSKAGLAGAGEWPQLQALWPDLHEKAVLDLGCGYGWHCIYAAQQGARQVVGLDSSSKMIKVAQEQNSHVKINYLLCDLEKYHYPSRAYDLVIANLVLHYVADLDSITKKSGRPYAQVEYSCAILSILFSPAESGRTGFMMHRASRIIGQLMIISGQVLG